MKPVYVSFFIRVDIDNADLAEAYAELNRQMAGTNLSWETTDEVTKTCGNDTTVVPVSEFEEVASNYFAEQEKLEKEFE